MQFAAPAAENVPELHRICSATSFIGHWNPGEHAVHSACDPIA